MSGGLYQWTEWYLKAVEGFLAHLPPLLLVVVDVDCEILGFLRTQPYSHRRVAKARQSAGITLVKLGSRSFYSIVCREGAAAAALRPLLPLC